MSAAAVSHDLPYWTVVSLRPASQQAAVERMVESRGARMLALPGIALEPMPDARDALCAALRCRRVIFTSPAAVEFADALVALASVPSFTALAVGSGTASTLAARGIVAVQPPAQAMRSEGVLALPQLDDGEDEVGLVSAPGGRNLIEPALRARGLGVIVAHVYRRVAPEWLQDEIAALRASRVPRAVLVTSGEALAHVLARLPGDARASLLDAIAVASSPRLADAARAAGFATTLAAGSPAVEALLDALAAHAKGQAIR